MSETKDLSPCKSELVQKYIGKHIDEVKTKLPNKKIRIEEPGSFFTMEYIEDRLRVILDENGKITDFLCG